MTRLSRFYMWSKMREIAVVECFFFGLLVNKSVHFSMLFICDYHIRNHIHHKTTINSARTLTTSKTIVKI